MDRARVAGLEWVRPWMDEILTLPDCASVARVGIFVTKARCATDLVSGWEEDGSNAKVITMTPGRPDTLALLRQEVRGQIGAMCVTVCGPGALADDVRAAVREVQDQGQVVDFVEESFTW
jgi:hypothetical protein